MSPRKIFPEYGIGLALLVDCLQSLAAKIIIDDHVWKQQVRNIPYQDSPEYLHPRSEKDLQLLRTLGTIRMLEERLWVGYFAKWWP